MSVQQQHVFDEIPAYALGSLDPEEAEAVEKHLQKCEICQGELESYKEVVDQIGLAVPIIDPPAGLKTKILEKTAVNDQIQAKADVRKPSFFSRQFIPLRWGIAGLVLILLLLAGNLFLLSEVSNLRHLAAEPEFKMIALAAPNDIPEEANGLLVISPNGEYGTLVTEGLSPLPQGEVYQLWLIQDGQRESGGTFVVTDTGYGSLYVSSNKPLINYQAFGVTVEPEGGSPQPTGEKVLGGNL